ncbi:MAG: hypothetical protein ACK4VN_12285 [Bacteroidales bacterium]
MQTIKYLILFFVVMLLADIGGLQAQGRFIRRLQEEAEKKAVEEIFNRGNQPETSPERSEDPDARRPASNQSGGGLTQEVPDVNKAISDASASFSSKDYRAAKQALRQALWGVELEMGQNVLASMPTRVSGLTYIESSDRVTSTGIGFVGLVIERVYSDNNDKELSAAVGNDAGLLGLAGAFAASGMYMQSTDQTQQKQIRFQDHTAYIQYDDHTGYSLTAPFGQSSIFVLKGVNFSSESEFMQAANQFSLQTIKQKLGEK